MTVDNSLEPSDQFLLAAAIDEAENDGDREDMVAAGDNALGDLRHLTYPVYVALIKSGSALPVYDHVIGEGPATIRETGNDLAVGRDDLASVSLTNEGVRRARELYRESCGGRT